MGNYTKKQRREIVKAWKKGIDVFVGQANTPLFIASDEHKRLCWYCGVPMCKPVPGKRHVSTTRTVDHITPLSRGGTSIPSNCLPCCDRCNAWKGDRDLAEFRKVARPGEGDDCLFYGEIREMELQERNPKPEFKPFNSTLADKLLLALKS